MKDRRIGIIVVLGVCCILLPRLSKGACTNPNPNPNPNPQSFANPRDFNGDCMSDILWSNSSTGQVDIWFMNGTTIASAGSSGTVSTDWVIQGVGDFDGDGHADILWRNNTTGQIYIWLMNGTAIASSGSPGTLGSDWIVQGVGDFNGDGKADILWRNTTTGEVDIWLMNGNTITSSARLGSVSWNLSIAGVADFNGDGKADILWWNGSTVYLWLMNGTTIASQGTVSSVSPGWSIAGIGDFNGDGKSDIVWWNSSTSQVYVWFMNGILVSGGGGVTYISGGWTIAGIGDFNGNGYADILWANSSAGTEDIAVWLMDGATLVNSADLGDVSPNWQIASPSGSAATPTTLYSYSAIYDKAGNVTASSDSTYNGGSIMGSWNFNYDTLNRLVSGTATAGAFNGQYACWSYDSFGNRTSESLSTTACNNNPPLRTWATYNVSNSNRMDATSQNPSQSSGYDAAGDVTTDGVNTYAYDAEGRVCAIKSEPIAGTYTMTGYLYDADGNRVAKGTIASMNCDPGTNGFQIIESYVLGPNGEELTILDGSGNWQRTNVYGGGKQLATYDSKGLHFQVTDPLGTRRLQTSALGQPETDIQSLPFGDQLNVYLDPNAPPTADDATPLHYTGKERDNESGNDYFGARYYSSAMGRFMSPDWSSKPEPVPYADFENPQSLNQYTYAGNNPLGRSDPDGHCTVDGENHGGLWCFAHAIGLVETQHEQANDARSFFNNNNVMINGNHVDPSKMTDQQVNAAFKQFNDDYRASGGGLNPGAALAGMLPGAGLKYESNPKHGSSAVGNVSAEPTNPQQTLENSVPIKNTSSARVGVDPSTGEYVMFRDNGQGVYHGYAVKNFNDLPNEAKAALQNAGMVSQRGKIQ